MSRLLPRYTTISHDDRVKIDKIVETANAAEVTIHPRATAPGDKRRLRGIPVVGVSGTQPGTDPLLALIDKEDHADQQRRATSDA